MAWIENEGKLEKEFEGDSFSDLCAKLQNVAKISDAMDHHPDFKVHSYKKIKFKLVTHSEGMVTDKDYALAEKLDEIFS